LNIRICVSWGNGWTLLSTTRYSDFRRSAADAATMTVRRSIGGSARRKCALYLERVRGDNSDRRSSLLASPGISQIWQSRWKETSILRLSVVYSGIDGTARATVAAPAYHPFFCGLLPRARARAFAQKHNTHRRPSFLLQPRKTRANLPRQLVLPHFPLQLPTSPAQAPSASSWWRKWE